MVRDGDAKARFQKQWDTMTTVRTQGVEMIVPDEFLRYYAAREYEPVTQRHFSRALRPGMIVADVGAHIGYYTLIAASRVGERGVVHAFEPSPSSFYLLKENVRRNGFVERVNCFAAAVGKKKGRRKFNLTGSSDSDGFYRPALTHVVKTIEVDTVTLDEAMLTRLDAVKIDVEGAELEVLEGMRLILESGELSVLCVEWFPAGMRAAGIDPVELPTLIRSLGFSRVEALDDWGQVVLSLDEAITASAHWDDQWYVNLFATR